MAIMIFFIVIWALVTLSAFRRKAGPVIAVGGGFIVGCLALIPIVVGGNYLDEKYGPEADQQTQHSLAAPATNSKGLGINHDQLLAALGPFAPTLKPAPTTPDGRTRLVGRTGGDSAGVMDISGVELHQSVEKTTLSIIVSTDDALNSVNANMLERFLSVLFPSWPERSEWAIKVVQAGNKDSMEIDGKRITFIPAVEVQLLMFAVEPL
ncbi:hypothetical protein [Stutzerimonas stutzeri]|uniref:hypothetical protein n=1 Tax=Stutzerimonas stutzeri TaxID=316 RepID=UPI00210B9EF5|nr:hypothetical protein [Stutzerimonas stutzeri]MCQ4242397.1 hypothetical protein [Stutzerimonas stutzeri]